MKKMPKLMQFARSNKEIVASEDEIENTCLNKISP
jgi:hypothetical protein